MQNNSRNLSVGHLTLRELAIFAMLGTLMFCSKKLMEVLPNIHLLGMFTITFTVVYRLKALIPIYIYIFLDGLFGGFSLWWLPYLYIWAILWALTMLLPRKMPTLAKSILYPALCALHGFAFGILYMPAQSVMFGLNLEQSLAWVVTGLPFDLLHGFSNLVAGLLILPLTKVLLTIEQRAVR